jgi:hypothetical protein
VPQTLDLESIRKTESILNIECHISKKGLRQIVTDFDRNDTIFVLQYITLGRLYSETPKDLHRPTFGFICLNDTLLFTFRHLIPTNCLVFDDDGVIIDGYSIVRYKPTNSQLYICDLLIDI